LTAGHRVEPVGPPAHAGPSRRARTN
jgi:hypothetical protein